MSDLGNGANWLKIYDQFHVAQPHPEQIGKYYPISPILIPTVLDNYTVAVFSKPSSPKPTWTFGGKVYPLVSVSNSDISVGKYNSYYSLGINETTIFKVAKISTYYRLLVQVPKWFVDVYLQAWVFTGEEPSNNIEMKIDNIKLQLNRIEQEINMNTGQ
jgi:hypothetical protein